MNIYIRVLSWAAFNLLLLTACKTEQVAPKEDFTFKHYQMVSLDYGDSLVRFHLSETPGDMKTDLDKTYYWFRRDTIGASQGQYTGKLLDGEYTVVRQKDKSLMTKGGFEEGLMSGRWVFWYPNGKIRKAYTYKSGLKDGQYLLQASKGAVTEKGVFAKGKLDGLREYFRADTVFKAIKYKKGIPVDTIP